ncbi:MAG: RNA polymerase II-associated protein [Candidatus Electrothrix sp. ATG1]|nr:RNA polymerase II-associated protein [Candidatus Electrothrix sp. ATG1]MCI5211609.1 RNA polymerase II-associated protein [Candidatus Electrothrix sp. ATG2]
MELECAKYGEKMDAEQATCRHPGDYCQHRKSCIIQFIELEKKREKIKKKPGESNNSPDTSI